MNERELERMARTITKKSDHELVIWYESTKVNCDFCDEVKALVTNEMVRRWLLDDEPLLSIPIGVSDDGR